jgi:two-component system response regulator MprA
MQRAQVLVVDDDESMRDLLRSVCEMAGYEAATASDGAEALGMLLRAEQPWIVLMDVMMPRMSGLEVCAHLAAAGGVAARHLVVLLSAGHLPDGNPPPPVWAMLGKPFDLNNLIAILARLELAAQQQTATEGGPEDNALSTNHVHGRRAARTGGAYAA